MGASNPGTLKAADYARLSRDRKKLSINVGIQHRENSGYIEDRGWEHVASFQDDDRSASKYSTKPRPGYEQLIAAVTRNEIDVIVVTEMARLYRQVDQLLELIKLAQTTSLTAIWATDGDGYDLSTPEGIHRAIGAVNNSQRESGVASVRQKRKKREQARNGQYMGGGRAYGFEGPIKDEHGNYINRGQINIAERPEEIARLLNWWERLIAREPQSSIIRELNSLGIPSTNGGRWQAANFTRTVTKERYVIFDDDDPEQRGTLLHQGERHRAQWRGLISRRRHELLLSVLKETGQPWPHGPIKGRTYVLTGYVYCGATYQGQICDTRCYGNGRVTTSGRYQRRYRCRPVDNTYRELGCGKTFRDADALEAFVLECAVYRLNTPELRAALVADGDLEQANELAGQLATYRRELEQKAKDHALGAYSLEEYKLIRSTIQSAIDGAKDQLTKLQRQRTMGMLPEGLTVEQVKAMTIEQQRLILDLAGVEKVIIRPSKPGSALWQGHRFKPEDVEIVWSR